MAVPTLTDRASKRAPFRIPFWLGTCLFLAIAIFFLWEEHRAHLFGALPYVLLLAFPLLHFLMHRGHGSGKGYGADDEPDHRHEGGPP